MTTPLHPESINARLAAYLEDQRPSIIRDCMQRAGHDESIPTEKLTSIELRAHLPRLFDDLTDALRQSGSSLVTRRTADDVAHHSAVRWSQGYGLAELLREIAHLRTAFTNRLLMFEELNPDFGMGARMFASATIHRFLDDLGIQASERFLKAHGIDAITADSHRHPQEAALAGIT